MDIYNEFTGLRQDGRLPSEMRYIEAQISTISGCTGSSHIKMGQTEVYAQIFGPQEGKSGDGQAEIIVRLEFADFAKAPHATDVEKTRRGRESEVIIKKTFEQAIKRETYPNSKIEICITVLQDDGSTQAASINAASLALIDAGIPMWDFVVAMSVAYIADTAFLDAGRNESGSRYPLLDIAIYPSTSQIITMNMSQKITPEAAKSLTVLAIGGCIKLHTILANAVRVCSNFRMSGIQIL